MPRTTRKQRRAGADFAIEIKFAPGTPDPTRVFRSMTQLIDTFQQFDREIVRTIDSGIQPVMVLEDVEAGSIKSWVRSFLNSIDDTGLGEGDWKKVLGKFLVTAKYKLLKALEENPRVGREQIQIIQAEIQYAAEQTGVKRIPAYTAPSRAMLVQSIMELSSAMKLLQQGDKAILQTPEGLAIVIPLVNISPEEAAELLVDETILHNEEMILRVKKPDFLGDSQWEFIHDGKLDARIVDVTWLTSFRNDEIVLLPGSSLRALVHVEVNYGHDRELVSRRYTVVKVLEVIHPPLHEQQNLLTDR